MALTIQIVDLRINNLKSIFNTLRGFGFEVQVVSSANEFDKRSDLLVLPGVGHFETAVRNIDELGFRDLISRYAEQRGAVIGICLGMQLMLERSEESPGSAGLNLIPGEVIKLDSWNERVPNVGWKEIHLQPNDPLTVIVGEADCFYFTHSYIASVAQEFIRGKSRHGALKFPSMIQKDTLVGIQFHPEKSGALGKQLLRNLIQEVVNR